MKTICHVEIPICLRLFTQRARVRIMGSTIIWALLCIISIDVYMLHGWMVEMACVDVTASLNSFLGPSMIRHPFNDGEPWKHIDLRYLATMADVPAIINIAISLKIQPNDGPVFYKVDGTRFGQSRTIKMLTGSKYKIEVIVKPGSAEAT